MKHLLSTASILLLGLALTVTACGKDKKPTTTDPAKAEPAATEPAKADPAKAEPTAADPKPADKPTGAGGW